MVRRLKELCITYCKFSRLNNWRMPDIPAKFKNSLNLVKNMGWRYTGFRMKHEFLKRSGLLKKKFPQSPPFKQYISLSEWKEKTSKFFFNSKEDLLFEK